MIGHFLHTCEALSLITNTETKKVNYIYSNFRNGRIPHNWLSYLSTLNINMQMPNTVIKN